jgi:LysM repeat protein
MSRKYRVQAGDTLSEIAQRFYGDSTLFGLIATANQLADPNKIIVGQVLAIPDLPNHWDVVQVTRGDQIRKTGFLAIKIPCKVPAGMRLVIEAVSARCVNQKGMLFPLALGEVNALGCVEKPLGCFPWIQSFVSEDLEDEWTPRWFGFHTATRLYVGGPVDHITFSSGFIGLENNEGFAEATICVTGYLEAAPPG